MMSETAYPYNAATDFLCWYVSELVTPVKPLSHTMVKPNSTLALKQAIAAGPTLVAVEADQPCF